MEVTDINIMRTFFREQILCPLNEGVPKESFHVASQRNKRASLRELPPVLNCNLGTVIKQFFSSQMNSTSLLYVRTSLQLTLTKQQGRYVPAQIACVGAGPRTRLNQKI